MQGSFFVRRQEYHKECRIDWATTIVCEVHYGQQKEHSGSL